MQFTIDIPQADWDRLVAVAARQKTTPAAVLSDHLTRFLVGLKGEDEADLNRRLGAGLGKLTLTEKADLAAQLKA